MRASSSSPAIAVGQTLDDKYQVLDVLGEGTMGTVYAAWHLGLEQRVALKVLRRGDEQYELVARQRFRREARAAARIQSEFICRVLDTGTLSDDTPYLVMEYLEGNDLSQELVARGRLELAEAIRYVRQTCAAVGEAHRAGIIHRDLKPANLFLQQSVRNGPSVKVLDFGVSKSNAAQAAELSLTRASALVGSPLYMSPEQLDSEQEVDARSDIWALGAILVELITGLPPFDEESIGQLVGAIMQRATPTLAERGCHVPLGLEAVVQKAMQKDRAHRYQSADELSDALAPFEGLLDPRASIITNHSGSYRLPSTVPVHSIANGAISSTSQSGPSAVTAQPSQVPQAPRANHGRLAAVLAAGVALGALAAVAFRAEPVAKHLPPPVLPTAPAAAAVAPSPERPAAPSAVAPLTVEPPAIAEATAAPLLDDDTSRLIEQPASALPPVAEGAALEQSVIEPTAPVADAVPTQELSAPPVGASARPIGSSHARIPRASTPARPAEVSAPAAPAETSELPNFGGRR